MEGCQEVSGFARTSRSLIHHPEQKSELIRCSQIFFEQNILAMCVQLWYPVQSLNQTIEVTTDQS